MDNMNVTALSEAQQRIYVDAIFAMATADGFELAVIKREENYDRPITYGKRIGKFWIEISCKFMHDDDPLPGVTKGAWEVEVSEDDPRRDGGRKIDVVFLALHATDALRIVKRLLGFYHSPTCVPERMCLAA